MTPPPSFLFLMTDQQRADHTGFGGNPVLRTPHLDALAARGTVFDRAFVSNPICMPNRATIMTGRMPSAHGTRINGIPLDWRANTFVRVLREHGYHTAHVGKSHLQSMGVAAKYIEGLLGPRPQGDAVAADLPPGWDELEHGSRYRSGDPPPLPDDFYGFEQASFAIGHGDMCGGHYYCWLLEQGFDPAQLRGPQNAPEVYEDWAQVYQTAVPVELYPTRWVTARAIEEIEAAGREGRPFFVHCSWPDPHHPFTPPGDYWKRYGPDEVPLPESFGDAHERSMPHYREMLAQRGTPQFPVLGWAPTEAQYRRSAAAEYGMIELIDEGVGDILAALERTGQAEHTVVIFTSDHGDMFGDHGILLKHGMHYEGCTRVPLVVARPNAADGGTRTCSLASSIDLGQTILELAGLPAFDGMQGQSLVPLLDDPNAAVRKRVLIEEDEPWDLVGAGQPLRMRTLQTPGARLTLYQGHPHGELFDLERDPLELVNLFGRPEAAELQAHLMRELVEESLRLAEASPRPRYLA